MNNYIVSARKYRPASFATVVGQDALTHTLKTAIQSHQLAHAYLFCGPRGVGKTTCARIFAKAINCFNLSPDGEPCGECESCRSFNEQRSFNIVELDAASNNSVEDIRKIIDQVRIPPQVGKYRVFIIDEVHMLSNQAFNAFLKTLEEPPEYAIFILATTEKQKIIPTILSRCQIYDFARITVPSIVRQLQLICDDKGITAEAAALNVIAQKADGAMRDALSIFDQVAASSQGDITYQSTIENLNVLDHDYYFRLDEAFLAGDVPEVLLIYKEVRDHGFDSLFFVNGLAAHLRDLMVASSPKSASLLEMNDEVAQRHVQQAAKFSPRFFYTAMDLCNQCDLNYRNTTSKQFVVELLLIKLCQLNNPQIAPLSTQANTSLKPVQTPAAAPQQHKPANSEPQPPQPAPKTPTEKKVQQATPSEHATANESHATSPAKRVMKRSSTLSVKIGQGQKAGHDNLQQNDDNKSNVSQSVRRGEFTVEQLHKAWQQYIEQNQHEKVIITAMRNNLPKQDEHDKDAYTVEVDNDAQLKMLNNGMRKLLDFLHDSVGNDLFTLRVTLREQADRRAWTDREVIEDMKKREPGLTQFIADFNLKLG